MLVRPLRPGRKNFVALFVVAIALGTAWISQRGHHQGSREAAPPADGGRQGEVEVGFETEPGRPRPKVSRDVDFDFYLLALSSHPAFCADGHSRKAECRSASTPISIHGLWPERLAAGTYPHDCAGPGLALEADLERRLATLMPGMADGLHEHEWREHGTCSGLDDDTYFTFTYARAAVIHDALGAYLTTLAGRRASAADLRAQADAAHAGLGATLTFHCRTLRDAPREHRREPYLVEIRQCIDDDGPGGAPGMPIRCATVNRRDQGCGGQFRIAP